MSGGPITMMQLAVLSCLLDGELPGRDLRAELSRRSVATGRPAFYRLLSRMEETGLVMGNYRIRNVGSQTIKERLYRLTGEGQQAWNDAMLLLNIRQQCGVLGGLPT